jgi:uncharacterized protein YoxC
MAQTARVTLTLSNIATEEDINNLEERIMSALSDAVAQIKSTVANLTVAQSPEKVAELEAAVQAERDKFAALVASEEAEDVTQNQELADARAQTDALLSEMNTAATDLQGVSAQLSALGTAVDDAPDEQPVGEVPVEIPAPDAEVQTPEPAPAPAEGEATPGEGTTPAPSNEGTTDVGVSPDGGAPAEAGPTPAPAPATGPVDASGNPVEGPRL